MKEGHMSITIGALLHIELPTRDDQLTTSVIGQVTGIAESFMKPDSVRVLIAGMDNWIDLDGKTYEVRA
jgi:hypothetical protein